MIEVKLKDIMWRPLFRFHVKFDTKLGDLVEYNGRFFVRAPDNYPREYREVRPFKVLNVEDDYLS